MPSVHRIGHLPNTKGSRRLSARTWSGCGPNGRRAAHGISPAVDARWLRPADPIPASRGDRARFTRSQSASCGEDFFARYGAIQRLDQRLHLGELVACALRCTPIEGGSQHFRMCVPFLDHALASASQRGKSFAHSVTFASSILSGKTAVEIVSSPRRGRICAGDPVTPARNKARPQRPSVRFGAIVSDRSS